MDQCALKSTKELSWNAEHLSLKANIIIINVKEDDVL
jgi:hypothetical protein